MFQSNRAIHQTGSAKASARQQHSDPSLERLIRRAYWQDYAVLAALGIATPQSGPHHHTDQAEEEGSITGGLSDHLFREALNDEHAKRGLNQRPGVSNIGGPSSSSTFSIGGSSGGASGVAGGGGGGASVYSGLDATFDQKRPGPFGGAFGDGVNRDQGSYALKPLPLVVPIYEFSSSPKYGERWDLQSLIEGFGPSHGP
jgi:hypothetical protein